MIEVVRTRIDRNERIAILFPDKYRTRSYARALSEAGLEVEINESARRKDDTVPPVDFGTPLPMFMPYPSSKGLTFDTVLMPRLNRKLLGKTDPDRLERWLFVAITRATRWLYASTTDGEDALFMDRFRDLERRKQMTIQRGVEGSSARAAEPRVDGSGSENELSDLF